MKVAIYSRVIDNDQQNEVQYLFDELRRQNIEPVIYASFFEQIRIRISVCCRLFSFSRIRGPGCIQLIL